MHLIGTASAPAATAYMLNLIRYKTSHSELSTEAWKSIRIESHRGYVRSSLMTSSQTHPLPNQPQELGSDKDVPGSTMNAAAQAQSSDRPPNSQPMASYGLLQISVTVNAYKTYQPPSARSLPREPRRASGPVKRRKRRRNLTGLITLLLTMLFGVFAILQWYQGTNSSNGDTIEKDHLLNLFMACQARPNDTVSY